MRRVDRRTNALQTDQPTDRPTDRASYRGALSHLRIQMIWNRFGHINSSDVTAVVGMCVVDSVRKSLS